MPSGKIWQKQADREKPVRIPTELHTRFKIKCAKEGRTMNSIATELVEKYLKETDEK
jgi:predicted DNA-binding protein